MRNHQGRDGWARYSGRENPRGTSRDEHRRKRDLLAAADRCRAGTEKHPQRDLFGQYLDRAPLSDDAAAALAGSGEDAGHGRQFQDAARALAYRSRIPPPHPLRMGQDRAVQGEGLYRGVAGPVSGEGDLEPLYSAVSESSSLPRSIPASVRSPASS